MKAAICTKHGVPEVLQLKEIDKPIPGNQEVLIKIFATSVTSGDSVLRRLKFIQFLLIWPIARLFFGVKNQRKNILGHEYAGEIEAVGKNVMMFRQGDQVFGTTGFAGGANAEYLCLSVKSVLTLKPKNLNYNEAAVVPVGGVCAYNFLQKGNIQSGQSVLIYGASGSIGTYAVQLAKYYGAEVTAVCSSANSDLVKSLGADWIIDYTKEDFTKGDHTYDIVFDTVGKISKSSIVQVLNAKGRFISSHSTPIKEKSEDLIFLKELIEAGKIKPVIDRQYPLEQIVEAHRYVDKGHKKGNVVITVKQNMI